jgi:hypothetical protein
MANIRQLNDRALDAVSGGIAAVDVDRSWDRRFRRRQDGRYSSSGDVKGDAMWEHALGARLQRALGDGVQAYCSPSNALLFLVLPPAMIAGLLTVMVAAGEIPLKNVWIIALLFPVVVGVYWLAWLFQFRTPYLATGSSGIAFPMACHRVIPWSNIAGFVVRSTSTYHGKTWEYHVGVEILLNEGTLFQYVPTWRMAVPVFGYRQHFAQNVVLLSTIYCDKSEEEIRQILEQARCQHDSGPLARRIARHSR